MFAFQYTIVVSYWLVISDCKVAWFLLSPHVSDMLSSYVWCLAPIGPIASCFASGKNNSNKNIVLGITYCDVIFLCQCLKQNNGHKKVLIWSMQ